MCLEYIFKVSLVYVLQTGYTLLFFFFLFSFVDIYWEKKIQFQILLNVFEVSEKPSKHISKPWNSVLENPLSAHLVYF